MDVEVWLKQLGLQQYIDAFKANAIDDQSLLFLSDEDLTKLGVKALGHRKKLLSAIAALKDAQGGSGEAAKTAIARKIEGVPSILALPLAEFSRETNPVLAL